jgi:hypothetical protein
MSGICVSIFVSQTGDTVSIKSMAADDAVSAERDAAVKAKDEAAAKLAEAEMANSNLAGASAIRIDALVSERDRLRSELIAKLYPETATMPILSRVTLAGELAKVRAELASATRTMQQMSVEINNLTKEAK